MEDTSLKYWLKGTGCLFGITRRVKRGGGNKKIMKERTAITGGNHRCMGVSIEVCRLIKRGEKILCQHNHVPISEHDCC